MPDRLREARRIQDRPTSAPAGSARAPRISLPRPIVDGLVGIALLSVMDAVVKSLVAGLPVPEVAFLRYLIGSGVVGTLAAILRPGWPTAETVRANAVRALAVVVTALAFFHGLGALPLAEALLLSFLSPLFTALLARRLLGETLDRRIGFAIAAGFAGVAVIVAGSAHRSGTLVAFDRAALVGAGAVLLSAATYSLSMVLLRARAARDPILHIVLIQNVVPALILAGPAWAVWRPPDGPEVAKLVAVGLLGTAGHLLLARAYAAAAASRLAVLEYTALIWAVGIGFAFFGEVPSVAVAAGGALILFAAAAVSRR